MWKPIKDYPYSTESDKSGPQVLLLTEAGMVVASCETWIMLGKTYYSWNVNGVIGYEYESDFSDESITHFMDLPKEPN